MPALIRRAGRTVVGHLQSHAFDKHMILAVHVAEPGSREYIQARERYEWLGQRHRLINLQRIAVLRSMAADDARGRVAHSTVLAASQCVYWSKLVADPVRLGRSRLTALEVSRRRFSSSRRWSRYAHCRAGEAWNLLVGSESWPPYLSLARAIYEMSGPPGAPTRPRLRLAALRLLETS
jgi:hypothetical protein